MNFILLIGLISVCTSISCYSCSGSTYSACNDPFNAGGSGVSSGTNSSNTYCVVCIFLFYYIFSDLLLFFFKKVGILGIITRSGSTSCSTSVWALGSGTSCCQTDLCNGAHVNYQTSMILLGVTLGFIFVKHQWI